MESNPLKAAAALCGREIYNVILCPECLILAMYLATKKNSVDLGVLLVVWGLWWGPPGWLVGETPPPLGPAEVGLDKGRVLGDNSLP